MRPRFSSQSGNSGVFALLTDGSFMKVQPSAPHEEISAPLSLFAALYRSISTFWHRSQIGHRSEYSVERLLAFRDYYKRTSVARTVAVCVLTPVPAIATALLIDCTPLRPPSEGWQANYAFWIRWFAALVAVSIGVTAQVREVILAGVISNAGAVAIALGTAAVDVSVAMAIAATWRFPIPFGYILMVGPYLLIILGFTLLIIGSRSLTESPVLRQQIKSQATIIFAQGSVAMAYPLFTAVFYRLSGPEQAIFVVVMPVFKRFMKFIIANAAQGLHEYVGPIVVFSVDVFNVYYVAICMQISKTTVTTLVIIASDSFHVIIALRDIFRHSKARRACNSTNYLEELPEMLQYVFQDPEILSHGRRIRVSAPFPLPLSDDSIISIEAVSRRQLKDRAFPSAHPVGPQLFCMQPATETESLPFAGSKLHQTSPASPKSERKGSAPRRLLTLMNADTGTSANKLRSTLSRSATEEVVWDALQALFHSEYLLLTEYTECALPLLYAIYLAILFHLPVARYYPQTESSTPEKLSQDVTNIAIFGAVEAAGFGFLLLLLRQKFGISPLYQLAFVLETQIRTVQGHLFVWTVFILHMPLMHYGTLGFLKLILALPL